MAVVLCLGKGRDARKTSEYQRLDTRVDDGRKTFRGFIHVQRQLRVYPVHIACKAYVDFRRDMKTRRSNRWTSCSFFRSAPCSGGMILCWSWLTSASAGMSSATRSLSQSSSSDVDGFFLRPGTSRISKNDSSASFSSDFLSLGKCTCTIFSIVSLSGKRM